MRYKWSNYCLPWYLRKKASEIHICSASGWIQTPLISYIKLESQSSLHGYARPLALRDGAVSLLIFGPKVGILWNQELQQSIRIYFLHLFLHQFVNSSGLSEQMRISHQFLWSRLVSAILGLVEIYILHSKELEWIIPAACSIPHKPRMRLECIF